MLEAASRETPSAPKQAQRARTRARPPFFVFCLHLFTFVGQEVEEQEYKCEGFTCFIFTGEVLK